MAAVVEVQRYPVLKDRLRVDTENARGELLGLRARPIKRDYGPGNRLKMCLREAPNAGKEAHRVWNKGIFVKEPTLSLDRPATAAELIRNSFAFVQVYGKKAGADQVATISQGLGWDRQSPMEDAAEEIMQYIAGRPVKIVPIGPHKLVAFVKGKQDVQELMQRFIDAPRESYSGWFPHLKDAQNEIQDMRQDDILGEDGTGGQFIRIFNGEKKPIERAYKDDGGLSFQWKYEIHSNQLWSIDLDNMPMSMTTLALDAPDRDTTNMLLAIQKFLVGKYGEDVFAIEFDFSETVSCCNISFNAQQFGMDGDDYDPIEGLNLNLYEKLVISSTLQGMYELLRRKCKKCGEITEGEHACKKKQS